MRHAKLVDSNKPYYIRKYADYTASRMNSVDLLNEFKNSFYKEKMEYDNHTLEEEINRLCPEILDDHFFEESIGKGREYAKTI